MTVTQDGAAAAPAAAVGSHRYFGKYRGTVLNNVDPMRRGRIMVQCPDVLGAIPSSWALPCFPTAGRQAGVYAVPQIGSGVWVEFEGGDPDHPIWSGAWYASAAEVPALAQAVPPGMDTFVVQTTGQTTLAISDVPGTGGILLKTATGALIQVNDVGITISNGKGATIVLAGPTVTVNAGALVVT
jgi:uncharacterized protein involved in type VI secretion and phage assembly